MLECSKCNETKPKTEFSINRKKYTGSNPNRIAGLCYDCKACDKLRHTRNKKVGKIRPGKKHKVDYKGKRICSVCEVEKHITDFHIDRCRLRGRFTKCGPCHHKIKWSNIQCRISSNLRRRMRYALAANQTKKSTRFNILMGCSRDFLKEYIEKQFTDGMSWDNYGKWHVDHILPCASFDLKLESDQKKCFNYKNLQPLWAKDNLKKGAKI